jgi:hypothetical protein
LAHKQDEYAENKQDDAKLSERKKSIVLIPALGLLHVVHLEPPVGALVEVSRCVNRSRSFANLQE